MGFLSNLLTVPGSSAMNSAEAGISGMAGLDASLATQYEPQAFQAMWNAANNPNPSTADLSQFRTLAATGQNAAAGAQTREMAGLYGRGQLVNGQPSSSFGVNGINNIWGGYQQGLMGADQSMLANAQARSQQALTTMLGAAVNAGNAASAGYGQQYQIGANQANQFLNGLGMLGQGVANLFPSSAAASSSAAA